MSISMDRLYRRESYNYNLPAHLIAQEPLVTRDHSKLLMANRRQIISHNRFCDLPDLLPHDALLVLNNSKVIASRLFGKTTYGGKVELFLLEPLGNDGTWSCLAKPLKKLKVGTKILFEDDSYAVVTQRPASSQGEVPRIVIQLTVSDTSVESWLERTGIVPLPPYIERMLPRPYCDSPDRQRYQTVYADEPGSAAAPTAGLHFTPDLFARLAERGIECCYTTLHVGSGTFLPVKADDIREHRMHSERFSVPRSTVDALLDAKKNSRPIIAVGTTSLRSLEAFAVLTGHNQKIMLERADTLLRTDLFIHPNERSSYYQPTFANAMVTNFHQPESSLLMLVAALMGLDHIQDVYKAAVENKYRFFSYGDACLFWFDS